MYSAESEQSDDAEVMFTDALCEAYSTLTASPPALLALHEVEKAGDEPDEDSIREALKTVLKRHPDWKQEKTGGIKVGAQQGKPAEPSPGAALGVTIF